MFVLRWSYIKSNTPSLLLSKTIGNIAKIERFLILAQDSDAVPLLILTKVDQGISEGWNQLQQEIRDCNPVGLLAAHEYRLQSLRRWAVLVHLL